MESQQPIGIFKNWVISTTSKQPPQKKAADGNNKNFKMLTHLVKLTGGTHSKIVHKRVKMVISTDDAYKYKTQSIRKAMKYKIPIINFNFLKECFEQKKIVNIEQYVIKNNENEMSTYFDKIIKKEKNVTEAKEHGKIDSSEVVKNEASKTKHKKEKKKKLKKDKKEKKKKKKKKAV
jgi:hypothetical protein